LTVRKDKGDNGAVWACAAETAERTATVKILDNMEVS